MKKRSRTVVAIVVALMMALPMVFAPIAFAGSGSDVKVHLSNSLKSQIGDIDYVTATIEEAGEDDDVAVLHKQGQHFEGEFDNDYSSTSKDVVSYVTVFWKDETSTQYNFLRESATGNGTINIWILDNPNDPENLYDIEVTKDVDKGQAKVGEQVVFTITATNNGPDDAENLEIEDILPGGLSFVSADPTTDYNVVTGIWKIAALDVDETATLEITAVIDNDAEVGDTIRNTASLVKDDSVEGDDNDSDSADVTVIKTPIYTEGYDIAVTKTAKSSTAKVGDQVEFTVTVTNNGPEKAENVVIDDPSPDGLTNRNYDESKGTYESGSWTIGDLEVNESATLTVTGTIEGMTEDGKINNTATFTGQDNDSSNNSATATVNIVTDDDPVEGYDIAVTKTVNRSTALVGGQVVFTVTVKNNGPDGTEGVRIEDIIPSGLTDIDVQVPEGTVYDDEFDPDVWFIPNLGKDETVVMTVTARIAVGTPVGTVITNTATLISEDTAEDTDNNSDSASVTVVREERDRDRDRDRDDDPDDPVDIPEDPTPEGPAPEDDSTVEIVEEEVPLSPVPKTGVEDNIALMAFLMLASLAGIGAVTRRKSIER